MNPRLRSALEVLLSEWHRRGAGPWLQDGLVGLEAAYLEAVFEGNVLEHAVAEYADALAAPEVDAKAARLAEAEQRLRSVGAQIIQKGEGRPYAGNR